ncbi:tRNA(Met) cytidine acetyltransferase [Pseudidiomarina gelatinasegens]|uniref:tRNA(Met) cytidine acetyltransferase n=1 Tax=Pseudidiomarina gelatinasegens TaxID=2487740 RepID=A0A451GF84_9GAMM|nr:GNAT family N-acetyltransferase [Pseudidiomarina gelatinasegens]RWU11801.1 tRNA(Met) cytidine acetyltransferase [Pseudidiomarina gelatinasegens]
MSLQRIAKHLKTARVRAVFLFDGPPDWLTFHKQAIFRQHDAVLHLSDSDTSEVAVHRYRDYLGTNNNAVLLEFNQVIHADALAALAGTVNGGGILYVFLPATDSPFKKRLIQSAERFERIELIRPNADLKLLTEKLCTEQLPEVDEPTLPNADQKQIVDCMIDLPGTCHILMADRGRGKSTTLGLACQAWIRNYRGRELVVTGPRPSAVSTLLEHAAQSVRFVAWDKLLSDYPAQSVRLIIDEAAAIPMHVLQQLAQRFTVWAIATTVDGYEGCGRGFAVRFLEWIQQQRVCKVHALERPIRWSEFDTCEPWLNQALLMQVQHTQMTTEALASKAPLEFQDTHASELSEADLTEVIILLLEAHYQSSPNDLRLLLDDNEQRLVLARRNRLLIGVIWYGHEGPLPEALHTPIKEGKRRLNGNILPQAIAFYLQQQDVLNWQWWRVTRIAVHDDVRRQGVGLQLLAHLTKLAERANIDALGSSFGASPDVLEFWTQTSFQVIRMGRKLNMASGYPNAIVASGLSSRSQELVRVLHDYCNAELDWKAHTPVNISTATHQVARQVLGGFAHGNLPFTEAQFAWTVCDMKLPIKATGLTLPGQILNTTDDLARLTQRYGYSSQQTMQNQLRQIAREYLELTR